MKKKTQVSFEELELRAAARKYAAISDYFAIHTGFVEPVEMALTDVSLDVLCLNYTDLIRQVYPQAVVIPNFRIPIEHVLDVFFIPDSAREEYRHHWRREGGFYDQIYEIGLEGATLLETYDSEMTKEDAESIRYFWGSDWESTISETLKRAKPLVRKCVWRELTYS